MSGLYILLIPEMLHFYVWPLETKMCSAVFVLTPLAAENVSAACVGWGKYAQIRERDPNRFSSTLRAHLCFDYL